MDPAGDVPPLKLWAWTVTWSIAGAGAAWIIARALDVDILVLLG